MTKKPETCKFTLTFEVSDNWIADGFNCSDKQIQSALGVLLPWALSDEVRLVEVKRPSKAAIARAIERDRKA